VLGTKVLGTAAFGRAGRNVAGRSGAVGVVRAGTLLRLGVADVSMRQGEGGVVRQEQTVCEMVEEVLVRQAKAMVAQTGQTFESALEDVAATYAGRQLHELANSEHRSERAAYWQASLPWKRAEERHYSWVESFMEWLEGKEARSQYHVLLKEELTMGHMADVLASAAYYCVCSLRTQLWRALHFLVRRRGFEPSRPR
jgi:hypothetical protein